MSDVTPTPASEEDRNPGPSGTDGASTGDSTRSKKPRRGWLVVAAAVAVVALVAVAWSALERPDPQSPEYSFEQLSRAAKNGDWSGVQRYMDVDAVAIAYIDAALAYAGGGETTASAGGGNASGGHGMGGGPTGSRTVDRMRDAFVKQFREALKKSVQDGTLQADAGGLASILLGKTPRGLSAGGAQETSATVEVPDGAGGTQDVKIVMAWEGDHWRIVALENLADLLGPLN